jgi:Cys-tRNA synthase (O-phospho-L-seryl-tRNA:Cys-tRNA synthase)
MQTGSIGTQSGGTLPQEYRTSLASVAEAVEVCGWCADQCIQEADQMMIECIRLCEDVVELGEVVLATVPRTSRFADEIVQTFQRAAQACAQECAQHQHAHCQDCAAVLGETLTATDQLVGAGPQQRR